MGKRGAASLFFTDLENFTLFYRGNDGHCAEGLKHHLLYVAKEVLKLQIDSGHEWPRPLPGLEVMSSVTFCNDTEIKCTTLKMNLCNPPKIKSFKAA